MHALARSEEQRAVTPSLKKQVLRLALVAMIEPVRRLLEDVLAEGGTRNELGAPPCACDVALVMVSWGDEHHAIADARALVGSAPILAILPFGDVGLAQRVLLGGAQDWFALDTPLALLQAVLLRLGRPASPPAGDPR